jgi:ribosomal protein S18 acetylase RimI-like enzyme
MVSRFLPSGLGPDCVGLRVVVRRVLPGETGPSGGPRMTDVLGVMEDWGGGATTIRREQGDRVRIALTDVVAGKPVPPKPSVRLRESAAELSRRATQDWPPADLELLGEWRLRAAGGFSRRANSTLSCGDPGLPMGEALSAVRRFYAERGLPSLVAAFDGTGVDDDLLERGWTPASEDILVQVAGVAAAIRALDEIDDSHVSATVGDFDQRWWDAAGGAPLSDQGRRVLTGPAEVGFAWVEQDGALVARGRGALNVGADVRLGLSALWTHPGHRRRGLGRAITRALLEWAAESGATSVYLQVEAVNAPALAGYEALGFITHHGYRYLRAPER